MSEAIVPMPPPKLTPAQRAYLRKARSGVLALGSAAQVRMQQRLAVCGLIARDHYGYFVLTDEGARALDCIS